MIEVNICQALSWQKGLSFNIVKEVLYGYFRISRIYVADFTIFFR